MDTRIAIISIIIENNESIIKVNDYLHKNSKFIIGRMGLPYKDKSLNIISVVIDAPQNVINTLSGEIGRVDGVSSKVLYSNK